MKKHMQVKEVDRMLSNYIDIHNHILPGVDDGSKSMKETIQIIEKAVKQGITEMIATPHYHCGANNVEVSKLEELREQVQEEATKIDKEFRIHLGNELMYSDSLLEDVKLKKALTLANSRYVLIEFSTSISYETLYKGMRNFISSGFSPIIAHVERYECLRKKFNFIQELIELGCYIQMNSSSLVGGLFHKESHYLRKLVNGGMVHLIASDSHDMYYRVPLMNDIVKSLMKKTDYKIMEDIFIHNPRKILEHKYI